MVGSKLSGGLGGALVGHPVGARIWVFLPSSQALEAVGLVDCAEEGVWCVSLWIDVLLLFVLCCNVSVV